MDNLKGEQENEKITLNQKYSIVENKRDFDEKESLICKDNSNNIKKDYSKLGSNSIMSQILKIVKFISKSNFTPSFIKYFVKNFTKFYGIRVLLELIKKVLKHQTKIFKYSLTKLLKILFNLDNLRTALFLTIMPGLYKVFTYILKNIFEMDNNKGKSKPEFLYDKHTDMLITFFSGFLASFIGILFAEKADIMNFVILSVMIRSMHSIIVVYLKKNGYATSNKFVAWLIFTFACFGALFLFFFHPSYKPMTKIFDRFALYQGSEKAEIDYFKSLVA
jgi:hypothetical protein